MLLQSLNGRAIRTTRGGGPFVVFGETGKLTGSSGVNTFSGRYTRTGSRLLLDAGAMTKMAGSPQMMKQEQEFLEALRDATSWRIVGGRLTLRGGGRDLAVLER